MSGKALLDTNAVIALFAGDPAAVQAVASKTAIYLCVPVVGELRYGALASTRIQENLARLDELARSLAILPCDTESAVLYGTVKFELRKKGSPIPENDVWIAAIAKQHNLILVSRDRHFELLDDLNLELL